MIELRQKAEMLAALPFTKLVALDETTEGEPIYVAYTLELEGCLSQGDTAEEALVNLKAAQIDFIQSLLEDGLPVPAPRTQPTLTTSSSGLNRTSISTSGKPWKILRPQPQSQDIFQMTTPSLTA